MFFVDVTDSITLLLLVIATVLLVFLGRELKKPYIPAMPLIFFLVLVTVHAIQLGMPSMEALKSTILYCIAIDCVMIFVSFFSYLWVDDIACKFYKKKSIDNSLDWFWSNV